MADQRRRGQDRRFSWTGCSGLSPRNSNSKLSGLCSPDLYSFLNFAIEAVDHLYQHICDDLDAIMRTIGATRRK
jgi:hypothetical protein